MVIHNTFPPNYDEIKKAFPNCEKEKAVFCYGEVLHNPFNEVITRDLEIHEAVHSKQQDKDPKAWWDKYIADVKFRVNQEIEAYGLQLYHLKTIGHTRKDANGNDTQVKLPARVFKWYLDKISETLSGPLYGNCIDYHKAHSAVRHFIKAV